MNNMTVCDKFQPTILEGQLCYTLDNAQIAKKAEHPTKSGKFHGLRLLLDPNPFRLSPENDTTEGKEFKVILHTLAKDTKFGAGSYMMNALKKMTGTASFKQLPDDQKKCLVHDRDECQTQKYLERVREECSCIPWPLQINQVKTTEKIPSQMEVAPRY